MKIKVTFYFEVNEKNDVPTILAEANEWAEKLSDSEHIGPDYLVEDWEVKEVK